MILSKETNQRIKNLTSQAVMTWGATAQMIVAIEEFSELTKALTKHIRSKGDINHLIEETADAFFMVNQIIEMFDIELPVKVALNGKMDRLKGLLND